MHSSNRGHISRAYLGLHLLQKARDEGSGIHKSWGLLFLAPVLISGLCHSPQLLCRRPFCGKCSTLESGLGYTVRFPFPQSSRSDTLKGSTGEDIDCFLVIKITTPATLTASPGFLTASSTLGYLWFLSIHSVLNSLEEARNAASYFIGWKGVCP